MTCLFGFQLNRLRARWRVQVHTGTNLTNPFSSCVLDHKGSMGYGTCGWVSWVHELFRAPGSCSPSPSLTTRGLLTSRRYRGDQGRVHGLHAPWVGLCCSARQTIGLGYENEIHVHQPCAGWSAPGVRERKRYPSFIINSLIKFNYTGPSLPGI